jgi:ATP-dependent Clp protease ATP-binding subunit ClpA
VTVAVVGIGPDARLELIAAPPRTPPPQANTAPKAKNPPQADEKS